MALCSCIPLQRILKVFLEVFDGLVFQFCVVGAHLQHVRLPFVKQFLCVDGE